MTQLDGRIIRCDWDLGFSEGRQFGRGRTGAQVRDEMRSHNDKDRVVPFRKKRQYNSYNSREQSHPDSEERHSSNYYSNSNPMANS